MKLTDLKKQIQEYQYFEDTNIIDISLASIVATRLQLGDPIWLILIGPSSSGKSQILRPLALTDPKFLHRVDDLTENTFLSGMQGGEKSLLKRIGSLGMLVISDLTVIFSKSSESRATILSQFRMIYDGEMVKNTGNQDKPIQWKGYLGIIAGSTPSVYANFEEVADMGERFIYYRMKPYDELKAIETSMERKVFGRELDDKLAGFYAQYIKEVVLGWQREEITLSKEINKRILEISRFAERIRTSQHTDWKGTVNKIPITAMPMRVALQLTTIAKSLSIIRHHENGTYDLNETDAHIIEWCGYSLANEEKRRVLRIMAYNEFGAQLTTPTIADQMGLSTDVTSLSLQNLASVGVITRSADAGSLKWSISNKGYYELIRKLEDLNETENLENRDAVAEEKNEQEENAEEYFNTHF